MVDPVLLRDYTSLLRVLRQRVADLDITHQTLDSICGLQSGYSSKLLCEPPMLGSDRSCCS
jgi:hypothetical protein